MDSRPLSSDFLAYYLLAPLWHHDLFIFFIMLFLLFRPLFAALDRMNHVHVHGRLSKMTHVTQLELTIYTLGSQVQSQVQAIYS